MKQQQVSGTVAILELTRDELDFIIYLYDTSTKKLNKRERAFFQEIEAIIERMGKIE